MVKKQKQVKCTFKKKKYISFRITCKYFSNNSDTLRSIKTKSFVIKIFFIIYNNIVVLVLYRLIVRKTHGKTTLISKFLNLSVLHIQLHKSSQFQTISKLGSNSCQSVSVIKVLLYLKCGWPSEIVQFLEPQFIIQELRLLVSYNSPIHMEKLRPRFLFWI